MKKNAPGGRRKPAGYWFKFDNLAQEIMNYNSKYGTEDQALNAGELKKRERTDILNAARYHGGLQIIAERLQLRPRELDLNNYSRKPPAFWKNLENVKREILGYINQHCSEDRMPSYRELCKNGRRDIAEALGKHHGGFRSVARCLKLALSERQVVPLKPPNYWKEIANLSSEIMAFNKSAEKDENLMPTCKELEMGGRNDITYAICRHHGGSKNVARLLKLQLNEKQAKVRKPQKYWNDPEKICGEIIAHNGSCGLPKKVLPSHGHFLNCGRLDLHSAIRKRGGHKGFAKRYGFLRPKRNRKAFCNDETTLKAEILAHNVKCGLPSETMPSSRHLHRCGATLLNSAIRRYGGFRKTAVRLGFNPLSDTESGYWKKFENIERRLLAHNALCKMEGVMPTGEHLSNCGESKLLDAIYRHFGGLRKVAKRLDLQFGGPGRGISYATKEQLVASVLEFCETKGYKRHIPGLTELVAERRFDLLNGIRKHFGSLGKLAQAMGRLTWEAELQRRKPDREQEARQSVKRLAASLEPLAAANRMSLPQMILILRRLGKLDLVTERVYVPGNALLLCRGIVEFADDNPSAKRDSQNQLNEAALSLSQLERAALDALSHFSTQEVPLDDILIGMSCKILWDSFQQRFLEEQDSTSNGKGLNNAQRAISHHYAGLDQNPFVRQVTMIFLEEVKQVLSIQERLQKSSWQGPPLRFDQAYASWRIEKCILDQNKILDADEPGMGKTIAFLAALELSKKNRILVIAPKTVADDTWLTEIRRCLPHIEILRGVHLKPRNAQVRTIRLVHYEQLLDRDNLSILLQEQYDSICIDEMHLVKKRSGSKATARRSAIRTLVRNTLSVVGLTGTPLKNELSEPLSLLRILGHDPLISRNLNNNNLYDVAQVYEEVFPYLIRRRKRESMKHLKDPAITPVYIKLANQVAVSEMRALARQAMGSAFFETIHKMRRLSLESKLEWIRSAVDNSEKVVILTYQKHGIFPEEFILH